MAHFTIHFAASISYLLYSSQVIEEEKREEEREVIVKPQRDEARQKTV